MERAKYSLSKRLLALILAIFMVMTSGLDTIVTAAASGSDRTVVSSEDILNTIERWLGKDAKNAFVKGENAEAALQALDDAEEIIEWDGLLDPAIAEIIDAMAMSFF